MAKQWSAKGFTDPRAMNFGVGASTSGALDAEELYRISRDPAYAGERISFTDVAGRTRYGTRSEYAALGLDVALGQAGVGERVLSGLRSRNRAPQAQQQFLEQVRQTGRVAEETPRTLRAYTPQRDADLYRSRVMRMQGGTVEWAAKGGSLGGPANPAAPGPAAPGPAAPGPAAPGPAAPGPAAPGPDAAGPIPVMHSSKPPEWKVAAPAPEWRPDMSAEEYQAFLADARTPRVGGTEVGGAKPAPAYQEIRPGSGIELSPAEMQRFSDFNALRQRHIDSKPIPPNFARGQMAIYDSEKETVVYSPGNILAGYNPNAPIDPDQKGTNYPGRVDANGMPLPIRYVDTGETPSQRWARETAGEIVRSADLIPRTGIELVRRYRTAVQSALTRRFGSLLGEGM